MLDCQLYKATQGQSRSERTDCGDPWKSPWRNGEVWGGALRTYTACSPLCSHEESLGGQLQYSSKVSIHLCYSIVLWFLSYLIPLSPSIRHPNSNSWELSWPSPWEKNSDTRQRLAHSLRMLFLFYSSCMCSCSVEWVGILWAHLYLLINPEGWVGDLTVTLRQDCHFECYHNNWEFQNSMIHPSYYL